MEPDTPRGPTATTALVAVAIAGLAWTGAGVAAVAGWWPVAPQAAAAASSDHPPVGVAGTAELLVATWIGAGAGDEEQLAALTTAEVDLADTTPGERYAARASAIGASRGDADRWLVTVVAEVLRRADGGYVPDGLRWYRVEVAAADGAARALGLPEALPPPR